MPELYPEDKLSAYYEASVLAGEDEARTANDGATALTGPNITNLKTPIYEIDYRQSIIEETTIKADIHEIEEQIATLQAEIEEKRFQFGIVSLERELRAAS